MEAAHTVDCDVLVVGAGPTGLIAADLLVRSGLRVRIVEKRTEASRESRAFAVQARTLELMQSIGLSDTFLDNGVIVTGIDIHVRGKRRGGPDMDRAKATDTPFPFILMIPQSRTEGILIDDLAGQGVTVERGVTVEKVGQTDTHATTHFTNEEGVSSTITSSYVIGADGSRSQVRASAGMDWSGDMYAQSFLLADCKVEWPLDHQRFRVFVDRQRVGLFLPLNGENMSRVMTTDLLNAGADGDAKTAIDFDLDSMQAEFNAATGIDAKLSDPVWVTRYKAHHRSVDQYRVGRLFVAGDAAHIHSPAGGQGMNTGLQDAANLAWKIAATLRRGAPDELLETYHDERYPIGQQVVKSTGKLFSAAAGQAGWRSALRDALVRTVLPIVEWLPPFHRNAFGNFSQRKLRYNFSRFVGEGPRWPRRGASAGERLPDARINETTNLYDLAAGFRFNIIALSQLPLDKLETARLRGELDAVAAEFGDCGAHLVARTHHGRDDNAVTATAPEVFNALGLNDRDARQAIYLVRPDGYVAFRVSGMDFDALRTALAEFTGRAVAEPGTYDASRPDAPSAPETLDALAA